MRYPKPQDNYSCEVICDNFMEIEDTFEAIKAGDTVVGKAYEANLLGGHPSNEFVLKEEFVEPPVLSVNGKTGDVVLGASDVGAASAEEFAQVKNDLTNVSGAIIQTASGESVVVNDASDAPLRGLRVLGKTEQNGTPTPNNPIPLVSVGNDGSVEVGVYGRNLGIELEQGAFGVTPGEEVTNGGWSDSTRLKTSALPNRNYYISSIESGWQVYPVVGDDVIENYADAHWNDLPYIQTNNEYEHTRFLFRKSDNSAITPDAPIMISLTVSEYEESTTQFLNIPTPNGLPGIPVTGASLATYTDENGQMWCADEVDFERGVYVKRVGKMILDKPSQFKTEIESHKRVYVQNNNIYNVGTARQKCVLCDCLTVDTVDRDYICFQYVNAIYCYVGCTTYAEFEEFISSNPLTIQYILATPVETPLTVAELEAYKKLHSNYPVTTILNDSGANMEVKYKADTKNYIDNKFAELQTALVALGGI